MENQHYISATLQWVDDIVIHHNFCPFARYARYPGGIHCEVTDATADAGSVLATLFDECRRLDDDANIATTLLILTNEDAKDFNRYLDILAIAEKMLSDWGYAGIYQLASFHPDYQFEGEDSASPSHFTNRSPYPLLHLIRESDISKYMQNEEDAEKIYTHNMEKAQTLGCPYFRDKLKALKTN